MMETARRAPAGFSRSEWKQFIERGYILKPGVLDAATCAQLCQRIDDCAVMDERFAADKHYTRSNAVTVHADFADFINRDSHIGYAYDLYGELTKVHLSQFMRRPKGTWRNFWHPDGPRSVPYQVFSPELPLQLKVAYWLTDLPEPDMGNLVILPGSHRQQYMDGYDTHDDIDGEMPVCVERGTMMIMHASTWHKVAENKTDQIRRNIFMTYAPAWICPEDRFYNDAEWLDTLNREQRILMRSYAHYPYANCKPPPDDCPLFLDRDTVEDRDPVGYRAHVELHRRKRTTFHEKLKSDVATGTQL
jgi:hypothetical protein